MKQYKNLVNDTWEKIEKNQEIDTEYLLTSLETILKKMNDGHISVVSRPQNENGEWTINSWVKKAILLAFRLLPSKKQGVFPLWWDKISPWQQDEKTLAQKKIRIAPGAFVRQGCYLGPSAVIMPSSINIGAWIDQETMIDYGACIGSCAFIGKKCHISANTTIGGVLEPIQSNPVIIEDNVFIGAGCHVLEGVHVGQGSILSAGVLLTASTKIIIRNTGETIQGSIPPGSVVVPGAYQTEREGLSIQCAVITKKASKEILKKTSINSLLRK